MTGGSFLEMGGYAAFVWPSYGAAGLLLAAFALAAVRGVKRRERQLADMERRKNKDAE